MNAIRFWFSTCCCCCCRNIMNEMLGSLFFLLLGFFRWWSFVVVGRLVVVVDTRIRSFVIIIFSSHKMTTTIGSSPRPKAEGDVTVHCLSQSCWAMRTLCQRQRFSFSRSLSLALLRRGPFPTFSSPRKRESKYS